MSIFYKWNNCKRRRSRRHLFRSHLFSTKFSYFLYILKLFFQLSLYTLKAKIKETVPGFLNAIWIYFLACRSCSVCIVPYMEFLVCCYCTWFSDWRKILMQTRQEISDSFFIETMVKAKVFNVSEMFYVKWIILFMKWWIKNMFSWITES